MGVSSGSHAPPFAGPAVFWQSKKVLWSLQLAALVLTVLLVTGCGTTPQKPVMKLCQSADHCAGGPTRIVQHAVDTVVNANFPDKAGVYEAVMWKDANVSTAFVALDNSIHITSSLYVALEWHQLVGVVAHELAHQEANHVLIGLGASAAIWVVDKATWFITPWMILSPADELLNAELERNQEIEADLLAVKYLKNAGYTKEDYLALLNWIKTEVDGGGGCRVLCDHPHINDRIKAVREGRNVLHQDTSRAVDQIAD